MFASKTVLAALAIAPVLAMPLPAMAQAQGQGQGMQNLSEIDILVAATMGAEVGQPGGARALVDRRLKLKACPVALEITGPDMGAAAVRCPTLGWRIRVPLDLTAEPSQAIASRAPQQRGGAAGLGQEAVKRGEPILLTVERPMFSLSRVMIADKDGRVGEVIPVRDDPKGKPIFVRILEPGRATILGN
jgi:flagella basal body P-ring formation protein FlgA